jgi:lipopolysaccharide transport system ATP-binding protein
MPEPISAFCFLLSQFSMPEPIIRVENLGKRYRIRHEARERYTTLRDVVARKAKAWWRRPSALRSGNASDEDFWALKDVSFEVKEGEVLGIIGRNGAGKSTLLKILSRITEPTEGRITLRGRIASLLEVGTGFHPELTGRENIFLNGAILGMTRAEIRSKFDEIVAFAEVEKFLDTPVKRYSSGMYVRLAFAVAAHLDPEILVVDEVLAVGDAEFQKKCLGKMGEVARGGRTVLLVSHQMMAVDQLCDAALLLAGGRVARHGSVEDVLHDYLANTNELSTIEFTARPDRQGNGTLRFQAFTMADRQGNVIQAAPSGRWVRFVLDVTVPGGAPLRNVRISLGIDNELGQRLMVLSTHFAGGDIAMLAPEANRVTISVPRLALAPGRYGFTVFATVQGDIADWIKNAGTFEVEGGGFYGTGQTPVHGQGHVLMDHEVIVESPQ